MTVRLSLAVFLVGSLCFRLTRLVRAIRKARSGGRGQTTARPIFWLMTASYLVYLAFCSVEGYRRAGVFSWTIGVMGLMLYALALSMREKAMRDLGRFFSPDIEIREKHQVVREGLYRYIRHPLLACMGWEIVGLGMIFNAYQSLFWLGLGFYMPLILIRKSLEERTLIQSLGDGYRKYQREVGAFWPHLQTLLTAKRGFSHV